METTYNTKQDNLVDINKIVHFYNGTCTKRFPYYFHIWQYCENNYKKSSHKTTVDFVGRRKNLKMLKTIVKHQLFANSQIDMSF